MRHTDDVLLVIDVQYDFMPGGALAVPDGDAVVPVINALARRFDQVVLTQDWHPREHVSFAANHPGREPFSTLALPYGTWKIYRGTTPGAVTSQITSGIAVTTVGMVSGTGPATIVTLDPRVPK